MLSERHRAALYQGLSTVADEEAVAEMLTNFPSHPDREPVGEAAFKAGLAELKADISRTVLIALGVYGTLVSLVVTLVISLGR